MGLLLLILTILFLLGGLTPLGLSLVWLCAVGHHRGTSACLCRAAPHRPTLTGPSSPPAGRALGHRIETGKGDAWTGIHVDTVLGQVTLHGTVRSAAEKETAETGAQQIGGVQEGVRNLLRWWPCRTSGRCRWPILPSRTAGSPSNL